MSQPPGNWQDKQTAGDKRLGPLAGFFKSDRALPVLIVLALVGFGLYLTMEPRVFPSASIDLKLSRGEIAVLARQYADRFGYGKKEDSQILASKPSGSISKVKSGEKNSAGSKASSDQKNATTQNNTITQNNTTAQNSTTDRNSTADRNSTTDQKSTTDRSSAAENAPTQAENNSNAEFSSAGKAVPEPTGEISASQSSVLPKPVDLAANPGDIAAKLGEIAGRESEIAFKSKEKSASKSGKTKQVIESTTFVSSDESKTFLEYQLGAVRANQLMKEEIPVWNWTTRFCKEFDLEQFRVWLSPQGKLTAFQLSFEDERRLPSLSHQEAKKLADDFLAHEAATDIGAFKLVADKSTTMAHRDDHSFTWEDQRQDFKGARLRYYVCVAGNRITGYYKYLHVPDKWVHQYANMRSYNELLQQVASLFYLPLQYLAYLAVPLALSRRLMRFRVALFGGLLMAFVSAVDSVNDYSSVVDSYNTTTAFSDYITSYYFRHVFSIVGTFISGACLFGGADVVYRLAYPKRVALENYLTFKGFKTLEGVKALLVGHCVFAVHLGWIIAYYLIGDKFGYWCPLGLDAYQILGSSFPFFSAISLGVHAAFQEEIVARVVALSLMQKLTGRFWIANLFQAASWGFMHSSYAQQPSYARGIELTIGGMFYGWILRRYGLLPCLIGHYLVDAFLDVKPLFSAQSPALFLSSFIPLLPFFLLLVVSTVALRRGKDAALEQAALSNENLPAAEPHEKVEGVPEAPLVYLPLTRNLRLLLTVVATVGLVFALWSHTPVPGDSARLTCSLDQAQAKAKAVMVANGIDPKSYVAAPRLTARMSTEQLQYVFEHVGRARTIELAALTEPGYLWQIRFFKFRDPREFTVELRGDGREYSFVVNELDDAPGKKLTRDQARDMAVQYMHRVHPEYKDLVTEKVSLDARPERNDWTVEFTVPSLKVADADYRASINLVGDRVGGFDARWYVPDGWVQERAKRTTKDVVLAIMRNALMFAIVIFVLLWIGRLLRKGHLRWKTAVIISLTCGAISFIEQFNHWPAFFREYATDKDLQTYLFEQVLDLLQSSSITALTNFLYIAFALAAYQILKPGSSLGGLIKTALRPRDWASKLVQEDLWLDGVVIALAWEGVVQSKESILDWLYYWFSPELGTAHLWTICSLPDFIAPVASDLIELFSSFISNASFYLVAAGILYYYAPRFRRYLLLVIIYSAIQMSAARHLSDYFIGFGGDIADRVLLWVVVVRLARFNPIVYITKIVLDDSLPFLDAVHTYAWPVFAPAFVSFSFYLSIPFLILLYVRFRNRSPKAKMSEPVAGTLIAEEQSGEPAQREAETEIPKQTETASAQAEIAKATETAGAQSEITKATETAGEQEKEPGGAKQQLPSDDSNESRQ